MNLTVKLDTTASPPLSITPDEDYVAANTSVTLTWIRATTGNAFSFPSNALTGLSQLPFSNLSISNDRISVDDSNTTLYGNRDYPYSLTVTGPNGTRYTADANSGNPRIRNN